MTTEQYPKVYLYRRIVQAKLFIDCHYAESIDIKNIANEACFSKFHFIRLFKQIYGKTPHQYLIAVRIEKAQELLRCGKSVSEVCQDIGFDSLSTFSGLFKRKIGLSPATFLVNHQKMTGEKEKTPLKFVPNCYITQHGW